MLKIKDNSPNADLLIELYRGTDYVGVRIDSCTVAQFWDDGRVVIDGFGGAARMNGRWKE